MIKTFYDLETTGLDPYNDDVVQCAIAIFDGDTLKKSCILHYYYDEMRDSPPAAVNVHHMSKAYLAQFKDEFEANLCRAYSFLSGATVIGFNNNNFDDPMIINFLRRLYCPPLKFYKSLDVMQMAKPLTAGNRISLINLCKRLKITPDIINAKCAELFKTEGSAHAAYYDVTATYLCYKEFVNRGMVAEELPALQDDPQFSAADLDALMYEDNTTPIVKTYEPGCKWFEIPEGYIPTCSDKYIYNGDIVKELPSGAKTESTVFYSKIDDHTYIETEGIFMHKLEVTNEHNLYTMDAAGLDDALLGFDEEE